MYLVSLKYKWYCYLFFLVSIAFGHIKVVDADTIVFNNEKIRLYGIDAPETKQYCYIEKKAWPFGKQTTEYLKNFIERCFTSLIVLQDILKVQFW